MMAPPKYTKLMKLLLQPVLLAADGRPGTFAVRDQGRRVPLAAFVAEVAVSTRVVVFAFVVPVLGVFRTDFVGWANWSDMVSNRPVGGLSQLWWTFGVGAAATASVVEAFSAAARCRISSSSDTTSSPLRFTSRSALG